MSFSHTVFVGGEAQCSPARTTPRASDNAYARLFIRESTFSTAKVKMLRRYAEAQRGEFITNRFMMPLERDHPLVERVVQRAVDLLCPVAPHIGSHVSSTLGAVAVAVVDALPGDRNVHPRHSRDTSCPPLLGGMRGTVRSGRGRWLY